MAPPKLPRRNKSKSQSKHTHIDFATHDSARASAPSSWTAEDWFDEATRQEEQGERYQSGAKATRHLHNAAVCYSMVAAERPADFDSRYNLARVHHTLATEHLAPPECLAALDKARTGYREALAVLGPEQGAAEGTGTARIDALFNLAQADVALFDMLEEAVTAVDGEREIATQVAREARELFRDVERLQRDEMLRFFGAGGPSAADADSDAEVYDAVPVDDEAGGGGGGLSVDAVETDSITPQTIVTPQLIIDTLLESISFDVGLYDSSISDPATQAELRQSALDAFARATALRASVPGDAAALDFELAVAQATMMATLSPKEGTLAVTQLASSYPAKVDVLSLTADHLVEILPLAEPVTNLLGKLEDALKAYTAAHAILSNRLSPPRDVPAAHLPSLLSANLVAQCTVHLLAAEILLRVPAGAAPPNAPQAAAAHLAQAHDLALAASLSSRSGLALALSTSSPAPSPGSAPPAPPLALARAPAGVDPRADWRTLSAQRSALFALARVRLRLDPDPGAEAGAGTAQAQAQAQFWALWRALGLARGTERGSEAETRVRERDARWWVDEIEGDKVSEVMGPEAAQREREYWEMLARA